MERVFLGAGMESFRAVAAMNRTAAAEFLSAAPEFHSIVIENLPYRYRLLDCLEVNPIAFHQTSFWFSGGVSIRSGLVFNKLEKNSDDKIIKPALQRLPCHKLIVLRRGKDIR